MIKTSLLLLLIAHLLGDFYFQCNAIVKKKSESKLSSHIVHSLIYFGWVLVFSLFFEQWWIALLVSFAVASFHLGVDSFKTFLNHKFENKVAKILIFFFDQLIHVGSLIVASLFLTEFNVVGKAIFVDFYNSIGFSFSVDVFLLYAFSLFFLIQPTNVMNRFILDVFFKQKEIENDIKDNDANAGVVIGVLERLTMYSFCAFLNWFEIIPVILTAKTFARFKRFDKEAGDLFAEKYIVGTLLSTLYVGICLVLKLGVN